MPRKLWSKDKKESGGSNISNTEWGIVIGFLGIIDLIQIGLDLAFQIGVVANRFIDVAVGLTWPTYLYLRGVNLKNAKAIGSILLTFFLEEIPDVDALPLWAADGAFIFATVKAEKELAELTKAGGAVAAVALAPETGGASLAAEGALEGGAIAGEAGTMAGGATGAVESSGAGASSSFAGVSDEYANAMGRESDSQSGNELDYDDATRNGEEGDQDRDISDEDADEMGRQSDNKSGGGDKNSDKKDDKKKGNQKKPAGGGAGSSPLLGGQKGKGGNAPKAGADPLNLREGDDENEGPRKKLEPFHSNLLDLSLSYGARKKQREENE